MSETTANPFALTTREQEIFNLLLAGSVPKEIAITLNISYDAVLDHQKSLYSKLDVHGFRELLVKFGSAKIGTNLNTSAEETRETPKTIFKLKRILIPVGIACASLTILILLIFIFYEKGTAVVFSQWEEYKDDIGSNVTLTQNIEYIGNKNIETYNISGYSPYQDAVYAGVIGFPDPSINKAMFKAKRFSFTVLGDGKSYMVMLPTIETRLEGGLNHYGKEFTTENGVISTFVFNIDELYQSPFFGKKVPFVRTHIEAIQIQTHSKGVFNLKFWDIRFY